MTRTKTLLHVWLTCGMFGSLLEYPLYIALALQSKFTTITIVYLARRALVCSLRYFKSDVHSEINIVDLPEPPWFHQSGTPPAMEGKTVSTQFIHLVHPHGMFIETGALYSANRTYPPNTVLLVAPLLYNMSPLAVPLIEYITPNLTVSVLKHTTICDLLKSGHNVIIFAGGLNETIDFNDDEESIHVDKYQYWIRMSRQFSTELWTSIAYDGGSRYFSQSAFATDLRLKVAQYKLPIVLPTGIKFPDDQSPLYVRHVQWDTRKPLAPTQVEEQLLEVIRLDKQWQKATHQIKSSI